MVLMCKYSVYLFWVRECLEKVSARVFNQAIIVLFVDSALRRFL